MGKYMRRKCRGAAGSGDKARAGATTAVERRARVVTVGGVRTTRSRSAAVSKRRRQAATTARVAAVDSGAAGCYLHLRSRRLFMATAAVVAPRGPESEVEASSPPLVADSGEVVVAATSRCSSTASSVIRERSGGEAEACESRDVDKSSGSRRERRETTSSSDVESSRRQVAAGEQKHQRRSSPSTATSFYAAAAGDGSTTTPAPPAAEIEEFFAGVEKTAAECFTARYNFDVAHGVPLNGGRFEWTPVADGGTCKKRTDQAGGGNQRRA